MSKNSRTTLGRGLDALIATDYLSIETSGSSMINEVPIADIVPNADQPRTIFEEEALNELANSIRHVGVIQPITLATVEGEAAPYKIISGERRYKAAKLAGLVTIPAYVRTVEDEQIMEMALIENIQREDLNPIEISLAFKKLVDTYGLTQDALSTRVGKKRSTISNYLRLLRLPAEVQMGLKDGKVDMGHARALLALEDTELQLAVYEKVLQDSLSVRQVEELVKAYSNGTVPESRKPKGKSAEQQSELIAQLTQSLSQRFATKVTMTCNNKGKGKITIPFASEQQLETILALLDKL